MIKAKKSGRISVKFERKASRERNILCWIKIKEKICWITWMITTWIPSCVNAQGKFPFSCLVSRNFIARWARNIKWNVWKSSDGYWDKKIQSRRKLRAFECLSSIKIQGCLQNGPQGLWGNIKGKMWWFLLCQVNFDIMGRNLRNSSNIYSRLEIV